MRGSSSSDQASRRRASYQRSRTVDALPMRSLVHGPLLHHPPRRSESRGHSTSLDSQDDAVEEDARLLGPSAAAAAAAAEASPFHGGPMDPAAGRRSRVRRTSSCRNESSNYHYDCNYLNQQRVPLNSSTRKGSDNELYCSSSSAVATTPRILERSPSSSSALLSKVKDRIVGTIFQTSSEGPQLAAIVQERRQRAAEEYEARLGAVRTLPGKGKTSSAASSSSDVGGPADRSQGTPSRSRNAPETGGGGETGSGGLLFDRSRRDGARAAFRRRSVSEDTCLPASLLVTLGGGHQTRPVANGCSAMVGSQAGLGGIVCSTEDFQALAASGMQPQQQPQRRQRTRIKSLGPRAVSFDQGRQLFRPGGGGGVFFFGGGGGGCLVGSQRLDGGSKILETFEENADCNTHAEVQKISAVTEVNECHKEGEDQRQVGSRKDSPKSSTSRPPHHLPSPSTVSKTQDPAAPDADEAVPGPPEVDFDDSGQTWGVHGAELDPEILGNAIQVHLGRLIAKRKQRRTTSSSGSVIVDDSVWSNRICDEVDSTTCLSQAAPRLSSARDQVESEDGGCLSRYLCIFAGNSSSSNGSNDT